MATVITHDLLILGAGLAGLRAAVEASRASGGRIDIGIISKVQLMRAHSVCAEGGTAAVMRPEEGDSTRLHAWDTVKGSDFLADQDVVDRFVDAAPGEILQLDHWGIPWTRRPDGRIAQRPFGGHSFPRAVLAEDKTGFFEMQTLYDRLLKEGTFRRYDEWFVTGILVEGGEFCGLTALDVATGDLCVLRGKGLIIASGGAGTLYGFTTYSQTVTGDGMAMAYRAGLPLEDMEFVQFHPTGLIPSGILITEACRGEGGILTNAGGERFMARYAPEKMELGPRDVISRAMMREIEEGRGFPGPRGLNYLHLDLRPLGPTKINERLPMIRELCHKLAGLEPAEHPIPVRPVAHYSMGGIETDIHSQTRIGGIWAAGEAACVSLHGANRLGANSTAECLVWGTITGQEAARHILRAGVPPEVPVHRIAEEERRLFGDLAQRRGPENVYNLRRELRETMDAHVGVFRTGEELELALRAVRDLHHRFQKIGLADHRRSFNTNLLHALELENLLDLAEVAVAGGLARVESRGAHARRDHPTRDDANWLRHTLAFHTAEGPRLEYKPVTITTWKPVERKY